MLGVVSELLIGFSWALAFLTVVFAYGYYKKRYDIIDSAWGPTFIVIAFSTYIRSGHLDGTSLLLLLMISFWGLRLFSHIYGRFRKSEAEDQRYVELRKKWPKKALDVQVYMRIYVFQALAATLISIPVILILSGTVLPFTAYASLGIAVWLTGFIIEIVADSQLRIFLSIPENRGKLMTEGLWAYSRHPNYFGEILLWWGIGLMTYGTPYAPLGIVGPIVITLLIVFVSGIPPAEKRSRKKPGWKEYAAKTNALLPWPPEES